MTFYSPLRYPGGKTQLAEPVKQLLASNNLLDCTYAEPYAGGCGVGLHLLLRGYVSKLLINDIDEAVYSFWKLVIEEPDRLIDWISSIPLTIDEWRKQRAKFKDNVSGAELGFAFFYLNRTNRSGVLTGGVIGGLEQTGNYKIDARFNRTGLIKRIKTIKSVSSKIEISKQDGLDFLRKNDSPSTFFFIDPPYVEKGGRLYLNSYISSDHKNLSKCIRSNVKSSNWILTYDFHPLILELYSDYSPKKYTLQHSVKNSGYGVELIILDSSLAMPEDWSLRLAS